MKFYIDNKEMSEKVFWRTLESLVTPLQRVHILEGMKVKIADYLLRKKVSARAVIT